MRGAYDGTLCGDLFMATDYDETIDERTGTDSPNNTHFSPSDASDARERKYQTLWGYNEEILESRNNVNSAEIWRRDRLATLDAIASSLSLSDAQHQRARHLLDTADLTDEVEGQYTSIEASCFGLCALVFNEDARPEREGSTTYFPAKRDESNPDHFVRVQSEVGLSDREVDQAMRELRLELQAND